MKDNITTVSLTENNEVMINLVGGSHVIITNKGDGTVYVSKHSGVIADSDGVKAIENGQADILRNIATHYIKDNIADWYGTIYALSDSDTKIQLETTNNSNFKQIVKGGGDNTDCEINIEYVEKLPENVKQNTIYLVKTENTYLEYVGSKPLGYLQIPDTPEIIIQPINSAGNIGDIVMFKVGAIGNNLSYQWQYSKDNSSWYKATSDGNTTDTLTITIRSSIYENYYRCVITDTNGNQVISDTVRVFATIENAEYLQEFQDKEELST